MTGSYNSAFHIYDNQGLSDTRIESSRAPPPMNQCMMGNVPTVDVNTVDFNKKTLHLSWHPKENAGEFCVSISLHCWYPSYCQISYTKS